MQDFRYRQYRHLKNKLKCILRESQVAISLKVYNKQMKTHFNRNQAIFLVNNVDIFCYLIWIRKVRKSKNNIRKHNRSVIRIFSIRGYFITRYSENNNFPFTNIID